MIILATFRRCGRIINVDDPIHAIRYWDCDLLSQRDDDKVGERVEENEGMEEAREDGSDGHELRQEYGTEEWLEYVSKQDQESLGSADDHKRIQDIIDYIERSPVAHGRKGKQVDVEVANAVSALVEVLLENAHALRVYKQKNDLDADVDYHSMQKPVFRRAITCGHKRVRRTRKSNGDDEFIVDDDDGAIEANMESDEDEEEAESSDGGREGRRSTKRRRGGRTRTMSGEGATRTTMPWSSVTTNVSQHIEEEDMDEDDEDAVSQLSVSRDQTGQPGRVAQIGDDNGGGAIASSIAEATISRRKEQSSPGKNSSFGCTHPRSSRWIE
ncbi:hypothetical protein OBBRIDRAFT_840395 [Obba rivulosa]|uniref:Uncharacterized protein n=1 Tax=Obba rivulosa TaxID=1052685 RepID=A0A8E2AMZ3_9APHY|nr:hypothetical protein OBBRIDRAFT_840395 [Obba rivulosa]